MKMGAETGFQPALTTRLVLSTPDVLSGVPAQHAPAWTRSCPRDTAGTHFYGQVPICRHPNLCLMTE